MVCAVVLAIAAKRPKGQQHFCADRGYDYSDVHTFVLGAGYTPHIKHRRRRGEAAAPPGDVPGEASFPARRWVVERTFNWLLKRRSLRTRHAGERGLLTGQKRGPGTGHQWGPFHGPRTRG